MDRGFMTWVNVLEASKSCMQPRIWKENARNKRNMSFRVEIFQIEVEIIKIPPLYTLSLSRMLLLEFWMEMVKNDDFWCIKDG